ncbi:MAG: hypothetical protein N2C14_16065 [Planctomycetales bacterium]
MDTLPALAKQLLAFDWTAGQTIAWETRIMLPRRLDHRRCVIAGLLSMKRKDVDEVVATIEGELSDRGAEVVGVLVQRKGGSKSKRPGGFQRLDLPMNRSTILGSGKVEELAELVERTSADLIVFSNALTSRQQANLEAATGCEVVSLVE